MNAFKYNDDRIFKPSQLSEVLDEFDYSALTVTGGTVENGEYIKVDYYNFPCAFDIETSSFYIDENGKAITWEEKKERLKIDSGYDPQKVAIMYVWQFGINGRIFIGRTWLEFKLFLNSLVKLLALNHDRRLLIYVHNLAYETGFIQKRLAIENMFAMEMRDPLYFVTNDGLEFRCSYHLTNTSLSYIGEHMLFKYTALKRVGDLDYSLIRHSKTPLTDKEIDYCVGDIQVLSNYIQEELEKYGDIAKIPLTSTGVARREYRKWTIRNKDKFIKYGYIDLMKELYITSVSEYNVLLNAYMGGYTHSNPIYFNTVVDEVSSYDINSSYPAVLLMRKYPMSRGIKAHITSMKQFRNFIDNYCCVFCARFTGIQATFTHEYYIPGSHCLIVNGYGKDINGKEIRPPVYYNGKLVNVNDKTTVTIYLSNVNFKIIEKGYKWDKLEIGDFYYYESQYLPTPFVECMLKFYNDKNTLKGDMDKQIEYLLSKMLLNSTYGMTGQKPTRDEIVFNNKSDIMWTSIKPDKEKIKQILNEYNENESRFIFFPWAIFTTAYAQEQLWKGIYAIGRDYIYSDTDSLKILNKALHEDFFKQFRLDVIHDVTKACDYHGISIDKVCHNGKWIGDFKFEGTYTKFKTLGAKRYMIYEKGQCAMKNPFNGKEYEISLTVAGVNKYSAIPYLLDKYNGNIDDIFQAFTDGLEIPTEGAGKLLHTYIDRDIMGEVEDYLGNRCKFHEITCVHLEPTTYMVSNLYQLLKYALSLREDKV